MRPSVVLTCTGMVDFNPGTNQILGSIIANIGSITGCSTSRHSNVDMNSNFVPEQRPLLPSRKLWLAEISLVAVYKKTQQGESWQIHESCHGEWLLNLQSYEFGKVKRLSVPCFTSSLSLRRNDLPGETNTWSALYHSEATANPSTRPPAWRIRRRSDLTPFNEI